MTWIKPANPIRAQNSLLRRRCLFKCQEKKSAKWMTTLKMLRGHSFELQQNSQLFSVVEKTNPTFKKNGICVQMLLNQYYV